MFWARPTLPLPPKEGSVSPGNSGYHEVLFSHPVVTRFKFKALVSKDQGFFYYIKAKQKNTTKAQRHEDLTGSSEDATAVSV